MRSSTELRALRTQIGMSFPMARNAVTTLAPSSTGMLMSSTIASGEVRDTTPSASAPSDAVMTVKPDRRRPRCNDDNTSVSSSTTRTVAGVLGDSVTSQC
jgi:hypothetical protein